MSPQVTEENVSIWVMPWEESEAGWGVRPDGYSIHPSKEAYEAHLADYWSRMPKEVQTEYERPSLNIPIEYILPKEHFLVEKMLSGTKRVYRDIGSQENNVYHEVKLLVSKSEYKPEEPTGNFKR